MSEQLACQRSDLEPGETVRVELDAGSGAIPVAVVRDEDGDFHAVSDICSHGQVSLSEGEVEGSTLECYLHGSTFDLRSGKPLCLPATQPIPVYPVRLEGEQVLVDVGTTIGAR